MPYHHEEHNSHTCIETSVSLLPLQSTVTGDPGRYGIPALPPVGEELRHVNASATTPPLNMVVRSARVTPRPLSSATRTPVPSVSSRTLVVSEMTPYSLYSALLLTRAYRVVVHYF